MPTRVLVGVAAAVAALLALGTWLAVQRPPPPAPPPERLALPPRAEVTLAAGGDTLLGDAADDAIARHGHAWLLEDAVRPFDGADFTMVNLEAPITDEPEPLDRDKQYVYKQAPAVAAALARAGVRLVSLANNHALDYGAAGLRDTEAALDAAGVAHVGAGADEQRARRPVLLDFGPGLRVGVLAYMQPYGRYRRRGWYAGPARAGVAMARWLDADVAALRRHADVVVVQLHAGENYRGVTWAQRRLARAAIDAGADVVLGHGPHVVQPIELRRGRPILHSLGNWVFGTRGRFARYGQPGLGVVARLHLVAGRGVRRVELVGLRVDNAEVAMRPRPLDPLATARELLPLLAAERAPLVAAHGAVVLDLPAR